MKELSIYLTAFLILLTLFARSQTKRPSYTSPVTDPLTSDAFDKYVIDNFSFALLGSQAPVSGLKVETAKPSITLSGNFLNDKKNNVIGNLELTGAAQNDFTEIFSKNHLNGLFKASVGFNFLYSNNSAKYPPTNPELIKSLAIQRRLTSLNERLNKGIDSAIVYECLLSQEVFLSPTYKTFIDLYKKKGGTIPSGNAKYPDDLIGSIVGTLGVPVAKKNIDDIISDFKFFWNSPAATENKQAEFLNRQAHFSKLRITAVDSLLNSEIGYFKGRFSRYSVYWTNLSIITSNTSFKLLEQAVDTTLASHNSFLYGIRASWNVLQKFKEKGRFFYFTGGGSLNRVNSLDDLTKFSYKTSVQKKVNKTETLSSDETGTAYQGEYKNGFGADVFGTIFWMPWKRISILGLYSKVQYSYSQIYLNDHRLSLDLGTIWNINNSAKESKNLLSIVPFVRWSNLLKQFTDSSKTNTVSLHDLFTIGIQFGVPINIGK